MEDYKKIKDEIESKNRVLKQLLGVYKTSSDESQKKRVLREIDGIRLIIKGLEEKLLSADQGLEAQVEEGTDRREDFSILSSIKVKKYRDESKDREIDAIVSYTDFFEKNYLPIISEYYLKLDFNHSKKRDTFYTGFMETKKVLKDYDYELEVQHSEEYNTIAVHRDKSLMYKVKQRYLLTLDRYFEELDDFLKLLIDDCQRGGNIVLNPQDVISLSELEENRRLDGYTVVNALNEMKSFVSELTRFIAMPEI